MSHPVIRPLTTILVASLLIAGCTQPDAETVSEQRLAEVGSHVRLRLDALDATTSLYAKHLPTGREIASFELPRAAMTAKFSPCGRFLIAYGYRLESCHIWEAPLMEGIRKDPHSIAGSVDPRR